jgi:thiol:disulfide interchange protein DsbD
MTVVATPCTAPFMGSALGFALAQPAAVGVLVFTFLGLGLAAPMVVLTAFPALRGFVPRPGPWMATLKQVLGFVLMGCVLWLLSVLGEQSGTSAVIRALSALLVLALAFWSWGRGRRLIGSILLLAALFVGINGPGSGAGKGSIAWRDYDPQAVADAQARGQAVFLDFTAAWCLTCQVNDRMVLSAPSVMAAFKERKVEAFKADWTNRNAVVTQGLAQFGRHSVPLYVYYAPGRREARILPELLTPAIVVKALDEK